MFGDFLDWSEKHNFKQKMLWLLFGQILEKFGASFYFNILSHLETSRTIT